jgi:FKBP-type peptidyl-prolyl cis-trans isomerase SlyD
VALFFSGEELVMADELTVADGIVVSMEYTLRLADGEVLDTSEGGEPLQFLQGSGAIISGLERELYAMRVGETKSVTVSPADGYGELDEEAFQEVEKSFFPADFELIEGAPVSVQDQEGQVYEAHVSEVMQDTVLLDFNHPLAGQTLNFDVRVAALRPATEEEIEHEHVHH